MCTDLEGWDTKKEFRVHLLVVHSYTQGWIQPVDNTLSQDQHPEMKTTPIPWMEIATTPYAVGFGTDFVPTRVHRRTPVSSGNTKPKGPRAHEILQNSFKKPITINRPPENTPRPATTDAKLMEPSQLTPPEENDYTITDQTAATVEDTYTSQMTSTSNLMTVNTSVPLTTQIQVPPTGILLPSFSRFV